MTTNERRIPGLIALLLGAMLMLAPTPAMAWWEYGHETVAKIAARKVTPRTRAAIATLLRQAPDIQTPICLALSESVDLPAL